MEANEGVRPQAFAAWHLIRKDLAKALDAQVQDTD
jgi:hypothetical protein